MRLELPSLLQRARLRLGKFVATRIAARADVNFARYGPALTIKPPNLKVASNRNGLPRRLKARG
jgi:hypothetical protein